MKAKLLTSLTALLALAGSASATDLGVRRPVYKAPVVLCTWCGFYAGVNAGGVWGREDINFIPTGQFVQDPNGALLAGVGSPNNTKTSFTGGGQIGVNSQWLNWVGRPRAGYRVSGAQYVSERRRGRARADRRG